jgi:hypothetical protein
MPEQGSRWCKTSVAGSLRLEDRERGLSHNGRHSWHHKSAMSRLPRCHDASRVCVFMPLSSGSLTHAREG